MEQPHVPGTGTNYRTPVKSGTRQWQDQVTVLLLGQELWRHKLLKLKDAFDAKDKAKSNQSWDVIKEDAPIVSSSDADDWQDVIEIDDVPGTKHIYTTIPPPYKQWYSRHIIPSQGPWIPKNCNLREDMMHQYNVWKELIPTLVKPMLDFLSKTSGKPSRADISMPLCNQCDGEKTSPVLCLFWDHK